MSWFLENWKDVLDVVTYVVTAASIVSLWTQNKTDDVIIAKIINFLALIKGKKIV